MFRDFQALNDVQGTRTGCPLGLIDDEEKYVRPLRSGEDLEIKSPSPIGMQEKQRDQATESNPILDEKNRGQSSTRNPDEGSSGPTRGFWSNLGSTILNVFSIPTVPAHLVYAFPWIRVAGGPRRSGVSYGLVGFGLLRERELVGDGHGQAGRCR
jgi:hypothetical protein